MERICSTHTETMQEEWLIILGENMDQREFEELKERARQKAKREFKSFKKGIEYQSASEKARARRKGTVSGIKKLSKGIGQLGKLISMGTKEGKNPYLLTPPEKFQTESKFTVTKNRPIMESFRSPIETEETKNQDLLDLGEKKARRLLGLEE